MRSDGRAKARFVIRGEKPLLKHEVSQEVLGGVLWGLDRKTQMLSAIYSIINKPTRYCVIMISVPI